MTWEEIELIEKTEGMSQDEYDSYVIGLKKENLKQRLDFLKDIRLAMNKINDETSNTEVFKQHLIESLDHNKVLLLEEKYSEVLIEVQQQKINEQNSRQKKLNAEVFLKNIDISQVTTIASMRQVVKNLIDLVNDD